MIKQWKSIITSTAGASLIHPDTLGLCLNSLNTTAYFPYLLSCVLPSMITDLAGHESWNTHGENPSSLLTYYWLQRKGDTKQNEACPCEEIQNQWKGEFLVS